MHTICRFNLITLQFGCSVVPDSVTPWITTCQASLPFTIYQNLLKLMTMELVMPSNHLVLCHPLILLPSIFPSMRVFSNNSALYIRWPKYWNFNFSISPSNVYLGLNLSILQDGLVCSACSPRDSQESSPMPLFESINSSVLSLLYGTTLTSIHDCGKNLITM